MSNYRYIGHGIGRAVAAIDSDGIVVKVPFNDQGILQNRYEYEEYKKGTNPYLAPVTAYDTERDFLYMELLDDVSVYFKDYLVDKTTCELYDEQLGVKMSCDGKCSTCSHNINKLMIPKNIDEILSYSISSKPQIGLDKNGQYRYFDYADNPSIVATIKTEFIDDDAELFLEWLNGDMSMPLGDFLISQRGVLHGCHDRNERDQAKAFRRCYCHIKQLGDSEA